MRVKVGLPPQATHDLLGMEGEQSLGHASCILTRMREHPTIADRARWLSHLFVEPEHRRAGEAKRLMRQIVAQADAQGILIVLEPKVEDDSTGLTIEALQAFYRSFGFARVQDQPPIWARAPRH